jgi:hypothetical protein
MLKPLSDINLDTRIEATASAWVLASGVTGTFVKFSSTSTETKIDKPAAGDFAVPVWSESNRDLTAGWSPDVMATGNLTVIYGKFRGTTDQFSGTPAVGAPLYVDANGKLCDTSTGNAVRLAICTKAAFTTTYLSKQFSAIEFVLV